MGSFDFFDCLELDERCFFGFIAFNFERDEDANGITDHLLCYLEGYATDEVGDAAAGELITVDLKHPALEFPPTFLNVALY